MALSAGAIALANAIAAAGGQPLATDIMSALAELTTSQPYGITQIAAAIGQTVTVQQATADAAYAALQSDATRLTAWMTLAGTGSITFGIFQPTAGTGNDTTAIQAAINAAQTAGGGTVWLGNKTWAMVNGGVTFDPTLISIEGASAVLDYTGAGAVNGLTLTQTASAGYKLNQRQTLKGFHMKGPGKGSGNAIRFYTPTPNPSDFSSALNLMSITIGSWDRGWQIDNNAYIIKAFGCSFKDMTFGVYRPTSNNSGENIAMFGCTFSGLQYHAMSMHDANADAFMYACSIDDCGRLLYTDTRIDCFGCHFEASVASGDPQFEADNGGVIALWGGTFLLPTSSPPTNVFVSYASSGVGTFQLHGINPSVFAGMYSSALVNNPDRLTFNGIQKSAGNPHTWSAADVGYLFFDTTAHKLKLGGASAWETVTSA